MKRICLTPVDLASRRIRTQAAKTAKVRSAKHDTGVTKRALPRRGRLQPSSSGFQLNTDQRRHQSFEQAHDQARFLPVLPRNTTQPGKIEWNHSPRSGTRECSDIRFSIGSVVLAGVSMKNSRILTTKGSESTKGGWRFSICGNLRHLRMKRESTTDGEGESGGALLESRL